MQSQRSIYERVADAAKKYGIEVNPVEIQDADKLDGAAADAVSLDVYLAVMRVSEDARDAVARVCANAIRIKLLNGEHRYDGGF